MLSLVYLFGFAISFVTPVVYVGLLIKDNIQFVEVNSLVVGSVFVAVIALLLLLVVYIKWIKKLFYRKLNAMAVCNELGIISAKPPVWNRIIKTIEYVYPFTITLLFIYLLKELFVQFPVFNKLFTLNIILLVVFGVGSVIFLIGDLIKISMMNAQKVEDDLSGEIKKDKLYLRRVKQNNKR